jgi:hypothetical protein
MAVPPDRMNTYQWLLRAMGAFLDEQPSCRISLMEVPGGFLVRLQRALHKLDPEVFRLDRDTLREQLEELFQQRKTPERVRHQGIWAAFPNGHADFFRALGYELDQQSARHVLIDEMEDGITVVYDRQDGDAPERRMVYLDLTEIEKILNEAFARRSQGQARQQSGT